VTNPLQIEKRTVVKVSHASILLVVSLSYLSYVFQIFHHTFWTSGLGDWMDPYFINYLLEHWYHSLTTLSDPSSPPIPLRFLLGLLLGLDRVLQRLGQLQIAEQDVLHDHASRCDLSPHVLQNLLRDALAPI
jgi:hypothetical protein